MLRTYPKTGLAGGKVVYHTGNNITTLPGPCMHGGNMGVVLSHNLLLAYALYQIRREKILK